MKNEMGLRSSPGWWKKKSIWPLLKLFCNFKWTHCFFFLCVFFKMYTWNIQTQLWWIYTLKIKISKKKGKLFPVQGIFAFFFSFFFLLLIIKRFEFYFKIYHHVRGKKGNYSLILCSFHLSNHPKERNQKFKV